MQNNWKPVYQQFQFSLQQSELGGETETRRVEDGFRLALDYWQLLKKTFKEKKITTDDAIKFFKEVKPFFTLHIEYYLLLNQALLFLPTNITKQRSYWQEQIERCAQFYSRHQTFIDYYEKGCQENDAFYFSLTNQSSSFPSSERIYEDADCRSSHDPFIRGLLAHRKYESYVQQQIMKLPI